MADQMLGQIDLCFVNSLKATPSFYSGVNAQATPLGSYANTESISTMRAALFAYDPKTYSQRNLDILNVNDLVFAWRHTSMGLVPNAKSIADYMVQQAVQP